MSATVFVAGATGFTGREAVRALAAAGARVVAHVRPDSTRLPEWRQRFAALGAETDATAWQPEALRETLARLQPVAVLALLGTTRARIKSARVHGQDPEAQSYRAVDYGLSSMLLRAGLASGVRPRFVYLSATGVRPNHPALYHQVRWEMEQEIVASGLPYVIARPSFIIGDRDERRPGEIYGATTLDLLLKAAGALGARQLRDRYHSTSNVALGAALARLALATDTESRVYESEELR